jgi:hypothetical protein
MKIPQCDIGSIGHESTTKQNVVFSRNIIEKDFAIEHVSLNLFIFAFN